jgi:hypothetical protein
VIARPDAKAPDIMPCNQSLEIHIGVIFRNLPVPFYFIYKYSRTLFIESLDIKESEERSNVRTAGNVEGHKRAVRKGAEDGPTSVGEVPQR